MQTFKAALAAIMWLLFALFVVGVVIAIAAVFYAALIALALNVAHVFGWLWF